MSKPAPFLSSHIVSTLFIFLICLSFIHILYQSRQKFTHFDYWSRFPTLEKEYRSSQYVNKHPEGWIPDEIVDSYNGGALIRGDNPVLIVPDTPPLGKYLIGLSSFLFQNENITTVICGIISLVFMYLLGRQVFTYTVTALIPPLLFSIEPMFLNQFFYSPLFDIIQLAFLLPAFYFFNKALFSRKSLWFFLLSLFFVGCFISTKFFITGGIILLSMAVVLLLHRQKDKIVQFVLSTPIVILVLLMSYMRVFAFGYTIRELLGVQKWIFLYHKSQLILPLSVWPLLLFNKWYVWFGDKPILSDPQWRISWPLTTIGAFLTIIAYIVRKITHKREVEVLMCWVLCYLLFFSFGQISSRYFVILIPVLYLVSIYGVEKLVMQIKRTHK